MLKDYLVEKKKVILFSHVLALCTYVVNVQSVRLVSVSRKRKYKHAQGPAFYPMDPSDVKKVSLLLASKSIKFHSITDKQFSPF